MKSLSKVRSLGTAITRMPAARPAPSPRAVSSTTRHLGRGHPEGRRGREIRVGRGLRSRVVLADDHRAQEPVDAEVAVMMPASTRAVFVTMARGRVRPSRSSAARAPGIGGTPA